MQIRNDVYNVTPHMNFGKSIAPDKKAVRAAYKLAEDLFKSLGGKKAMKAGEISADNLEKIAKAYENAQAVANQYTANILKNNKFEAKLDKVLEGYFTKVTEWFGKANKLISKNASTEDLIEGVNNIVIWGNVFKEAMGTALYTTQALTNTDLDKSERKFVGMYDLFVGITSTTISALFGLGLEKPIKDGFKKMFKPLEHLPKTGAIAVAAAGFTAFILQTIVGKRIVAPAIGKPLAAKARDYLRAKEEAKKPTAEAKTVEMKPEEAQYVELNDSDNEFHAAA